MQHIQSYQNVIKSITKCRFSVLTSEWVTFGRWQFLLSATLYSDKANTIKLAM